MSEMTEAGKQLRNTSLPPPPQKKIQQIIKISFKASDINRSAELGSSKRSNSGTQNTENLQWIESHLTKLLERLTKSLKKVRSRVIYSKAPLKLTMNN